MAPLKSTLRCWINGLIQVPVAACRKYVVALMLCMVGFRFSYRVSMELAAGLASTAYVRRVTIVVVDQ